MKTWIKTSICIGLSFIFLFMSVGYAQLTDRMRISGTAKIDIPYGLFIINISPGSSSNLDKNEFDFLDHTTTVEISHNKGARNAGSATYTITVLNNTRLTYSYRKLYYQTNLNDYNGNGYISQSSYNNNSKIRVNCSLENATAEQKKVLPGDTLTFTVTYTLGKNLDSNIDYNTLINYQFGINVEGEAEALEIIEQKFLNILNTQSTYETLIDALDNKFDGRQEWTSNYIGNVVGSSSGDSMAVNTLFAGQLQITVGRDQMDATVLIKHENLDGNTNTGDDYVAENESNGGVFRGYGCEMTLYLTIDPLNSAGRYVPVYAVVFTCDRDENGNLSDWYRVGNTYAGTANVVTYDGGNGTGSFVTDNWIADAATHRVINGYNYTVGDTTYTLGSYSYSVANGVSIKQIVGTADANATRTMQTLLTHAKQIIDSHEYAGTGITTVEDVYEAASRFYTLDANNNPVVNSNLTRAQLLPSIQKLYNAIDTTLLQMEALSKEANQQ